MRVLRSVTTIRFSGKSESPTRSPSGMPKRAAKTVAPAEPAREVRTASKTSGEKDPISRRADAKEVTRKSNRRSRFLSQNANGILMLCPFPMDEKERLPVHPESRAEGAALPPRDA